MPGRLQEGELRPDRDPIEVPARSAEFPSAVKEALERAARGSNELRATIEDDLLFVAMSDFGVRDGRLELTYCDEQERPVFAARVDPRVPDSASDVEGTLAIRPICLRDFTRGELQGVQIVLPPARAGQDVQPRIEQLHKSMQSGRTTWQWRTLADASHQPELVNKGVRHFLELRRMAHTRP
jgi:hypothetical protein